MVPWDGLQCVMVVFPGHTHLLFMEEITEMLCKVSELKLFAEFAWNKTCYNC